MAQHRHRNELVGILAAVAGLVASAAAQPEPKPQPPGNNPPSRPGETYQPSNPADRNNQPGDRVDRTDRTRRDMRSHTLVPTEWIDGADVRGTNDEKLGDVNDLIISREQRRVTFALVGHGGVLKVGEKVTAVPFRALDWDADKKRLELPMTKDQFAAAPTLETGDWKTLSDPGRIEPIYSHFNMRDERNFNTRDDDRMLDDNRKNDDDRKRDDDRNLKSPPGPARTGADEFPVVRVSDMRGKTLVGHDGRDVGKVDDLVIDANSGRVAFVAVTFGGVMGIGKDRVAVPWSAFDINKEGHLFLTNIDKETIAAAPKMTQKDWAELRDPTFGATVYKHYGKRAAWLETRPNEMTPAQMEYKRLYTTGTPRDLSGTIASIDEEAPMEGVPKVMVLKVNTTGNDTVIVHTCPKNVLDENRLMLHKGDTVVIKGREATVDGKRVVLVTQITGADGRPITLYHEEPR